MIRALEALRGRISLALLVAAALVGSGVPASATTIALGTSGWQATFDCSFAPFVDLTVDAVDTGFDGGKGAVFLEKSAEFGPSCSTIPITFMQTDANAVGYIVFNDEIITNSSGVDWIGFEFELLDGGDVVFDPSPPGGLSTGGFDHIAPFTNDYFNGDFTTYTTDSGVVGDGTVWFPGNGVSNGELAIEVLNLGDGTNTPFTTFTLKETPIPIPEPGTALFLGGGLLALGLGRRRTEKLG